MIKRTLEEILKEIRALASSYLQDPNDRTLGYLQLLLNHYDGFQKPIDFMDKPINDFPVTKMGQGRTDALKWLHNVLENTSSKVEAKE